VDGVMRGKMMPGSRASSEHPTRQNRDCTPRGIRTPTARSAAWCSMSRTYSWVLLVQLRSEIESGETARVLSGAGWWT